MQEKMLLLPHYMLVFPLCYSDLLLVELVIKLVQVGLGQKAVDAVVVELVRVQDFAVEMALVEGVAGIVDIEIVVEDMVVEDKVVIVVEDRFFEATVSHKYILTNFVHVGFGIVMEAKLAMAQEYSMNFEKDIDNSEGFVE